ncbi:hypothetical protein BUALT_Bualt08G0068300 [Buddleja alternifolia]|uniref:Uncharacterized protein n=1 Tax=Buddleja alternifolia TaxID=168488 RepID=A0AAV6X5S2_9LAMI|nr:hypothetical protein BUALT_Bualt08G0068300 [Buddleja alternifolia]
MQCPITSLAIQQESNFCLVHAKTVLRKEGKWIISLLLSCKSGRVTKFLPTEEADDVVASKCFSLRKWFSKSSIESCEPLLNREKSLLSFPSQSHPIVNDVEDHLHRLRASEATSTSSSLCEKMASLRDLHEGINNMIQMPSIQQALSYEHGQGWINELIEGSLKVVDICGFSREVVSLTKESIQDLESSIRRNRGETATLDDIKAYVASRKKINKMVKKCNKNIYKNSTAIPDNEFGTMLKETEALDFSVLSSVLMLISGEKERSKQRSWSFLSKFTQTSRVHFEVENITVKQLKATEMSIEEVEEGLESLFRSLIKTRVSLLNVISH